MGLASTKKKTKKKKNWREVAPVNGGSQTMTKEHDGVTTTYHWCMKC